GSRPTTRRVARSDIAPSGFGKRTLSVSATTGTYRTHAVSSNVSRTSAFGWAASRDGRRKGKGMAIHKTKTGYQIQWYDADGRFRKRTYRGVTRDQAVKLERDLLARRDRGEPEVDRRLAPTFRAFATTWLEEHGTGWKASTRAQYQHAI